MPRGLTFRKVNPQREPKFWTSSKRKELMKIFPGNQDKKQRGSFGILACPITLTHVACRAWSQGRVKQLNALKLRSQCWAHIQIPCRHRSLIYRQIKHAWEIWRHWDHSQNGWIYTKKLPRLGSWRQTAHWVFSWAALTDRPCQRAVGGHR